MSQFTKYDVKEEKKYEALLEQYKRQGKRTKVIEYDHGVRDYFVEIENIPGAYVSIRKFDPIKLPERLERLIKEHEEAKKKGGLLVRIRRAFGG